MKCFYTIITLLTTAFITLNAQYIGVSPQPSHLELHDGTYDYHKKWRMVTEPDYSIPEEGYTLKISKRGVLIKYSTKTGLLYANKTLEQLKRHYGQNHKLPYLYIEDHPVMPWRGLMIDVSRHFQPISFLKQQIDIMAEYKMNYLHLHLTDAAGWRMEIKQYPRLTDFAAWRTASDWKTWWAGKREYVENGKTNNGHGGFYTQQELKKLVAYAKAKGITIVPEIEMPGHSEETLAAYPELSCAGEPYKNADFCAGKEEVFQFIENVLKEVTEVFDSPYIHVGGDEAGKAAWKTCPHCQKRMQELNTEDVELLQGYFMKRVQNIVESLGRKAIGWDEILSDPSLPSDVGIMVWRGEEAGEEALKRGHKVIMTPGKWCYFDQYQDNPLIMPEAMGGYLPTKKVYSYPIAEHFYGIQGNMWTEYISSADHACKMLWPRGMAIAEIGWNGNNRPTWEDFQQRVKNDCTRWISKGYPVFDLNTEFGDRPESLTDLQCLSTAKQVIYHAPFHANYPAGGHSALTDGKRGSWANNDGIWQGFINKDRVDVEIDLGSLMTIREIEAAFIKSPGPQIYLPARVEIWISADGIGYGKIYEEDFEVDTQGLTEFKSYGWKGEQQARYVRYKAKAGEAGGWLFTDEIVIK